MLVTLACLVEESVELGSEIQSTVRGPQGGKLFCDTFRKRLIAGYPVRILLV